MVNSVTNRKNKIMFLEFLLGGICGCWAMYLVYQIVISLSKKRHPTELLNLSSTHLFRNEGLVAGAAIVFVIGAVIMLVAAFRSINHTEPFGVTTSMVTSIVMTVYSLIFFIVYGVTVFAVYEYYDSLSKLVRDSSMSFVPAVFPMFVGLTLLLILLLGFLYNAILCGIYKATRKKK